MGQAFRVGRYPIHFHINGNASTSYVRGIAIHWSLNRACTIHAVDNLLVDHNVAFNVKGLTLSLKMVLRKIILSNTILLCLPDNITVS